MSDDLTTDTDDVLQDTLDRLFAEHGEAAELGDRQACVEIHDAIVEVMAEQSRRLDLWIADMREAVTEKTAS